MKLNQQDQEKLTDVLREAVQNTTARFANVPTGTDGDMDQESIRRFVLSACREALDSIKQNECSI